MTDIEKLITKLRRLTADHGCRAPTLVPDLAFVGLALDCIDASEAALELLETRRPYRAYSMARVCFEATQRLLPLATSDDYLRLGTSAWVYYQIKDAAVTGSSQDLLGESAQQIIDIWSRYNPAARSLVSDAATTLRSQKGPDNFVRRNLADVASECYKVLAAAKNLQAPQDATEINRLVYSALSRDAHAGLRLQPRALRLDSDGFVEVVERERSPVEIRKAVTLAVQSSLKEAVAAVEYRLAIRQHEGVAHRLASLKDQSVTTRADYLPDLGRFLAEQGLGRAECVFPGVPVQHIRRLPGSTLTTSLRHGDGREARLATFDFKGSARGALLERVRQQFPGLLTAGSPQTTGRLDLPQPLILTIRAVLGSVQRTNEESFVPFVVRRIE